MYGNQKEDFSSKNYPKVRVQNHETLGGLKNDPSMTFERKKKNLIREKILWFALKSHIFLKIGRNHV
jgi:hypothetical protein